MTKPEGVFQCAERGTDSPLANKLWQATGEFRPPQEGEWYVIANTRFKEARRAHETFDVPQWIAEEAAS